MSCFQVTCQNYFPVFVATLMLNPFAWCCLNTNLYITSGLWANQHNSIIHQINTHKQLRDSLSERICWLMKPCSVSSPWNGDNRVIILMWRKFPLPSCALAWIYTHLLLYNNTVFMSNDSVSWAWQRPEGGPGGTDSNTLLLSHTQALMHIVTPHTHLKHTHCLSTPFSLYCTHTHTICVDLLKSVSECAWGSHPSHVPKRVAKFGEPSPSYHLTF